MTRWAIDHITVTAPSLAAGRAFVEAQLGVAPQPGGEHPRMGTHNLLLRLGESMFLEVIAVKPGADEPFQPRWFGLDELPHDAAPRLACWVARSDGIEASATAASESLGPIHPMSRGALNWWITIPEDGSLPLGGAAPGLIEWQAATHPASTMHDLGCSLVSLDLLHPEPQRVSALLASLGFAPASVEVSVIASAAPGLRARIATPHGLRTLGQAISARLASPP